MKISKTNKKIKQKIYTSEECVKLTRNLFEENTFYIGKTRCAIKKLPEVQDERQYPALS